MINLFNKIFKGSGGSNSGNNSKTDKKPRTLRERSREIISIHYNKLSYHHSQFYYIDNAVRDCVREIAVAEGCPLRGPGYQYLSNWLHNADPEYKALAIDIKDVFAKQYHKLCNDRDRKEKDKMDEQVINTYVKHKDIIDKFFDIAFRKVTTLDGYGDEDWAAFKKELTLLLCKIAEREGLAHHIKDIKKGSFWSVKWLDELKIQIESDFKDYYKEKKSAPISKTGYADLNGVEFENYLMNFFRKMGFEVMGTPATGDQGADMFLINNSKKIAIQAKKYSKPVGNKAIQEIVSARTFYSCDEAWVITNSQFTKSASDLAQKCDVRLVDGLALDKLISQHKMTSSSTPDNRTVIECVHCNTSLRLPKGKSGTVRCPSCNKTFHATT